MLFFRLFKHAKNNAIELKNANLCILIQKQLLKNKQSKKC